MALLVVCAAAVPTVAQDTDDEQADLAILRARLKELETKQEGIEAADDSVTDSDVPAADDAVDSGNPDARLRRLLKQWALKSERLPEVAAKLNARHMELQACQALAQRAAARNNVKEATYCVSQLRHRARQAGNFDHPQAPVVAGFWLLQADLFDINSHEPDADQRERQMIARFEEFLEDKTRAGANTRKTVTGKSGKAALLDQSVTEHIQLALLRLYDRRGMTTKACDLAGRLAASKRTTPRSMETVKSLCAYCEVVGGRFNAELQLGDDKMWASADLVGKVILIHFWSVGSRLSVLAIRDLKRVHEKFASRGLSMLSVTSSPVDVGTITDDLPWPSYNQGPDQVNLMTAFSVRSAPRYVLIDKAGRVTSLADGLAVLEQVAGLLEVDE